MRDRKGNSKVFCEYINTERKAKKNKLIDGVRDCGGLALAGCQVFTKVLYHSPFIKEAGEENTRKTLWVKVKSGKSFTNYYHRQNKLNLGKLIYCQLVTE